MELVRLQHHGSPEKEACLTLRVLDFWDLVQLTADEDFRILSSNIGHDPCKTFSHFLSSCIHVNPEAISS